MHLDRGIRYTNQLLLASRQRELSDLEILILSGIWFDVSYQQSSQNSNYEVATIKNAASKLLHDISDATGERVSKKNCKGILARRASTTEEQVDWGDAPTDMQPFCGRVEELEKLTKWLKVDRCKLVGVLGIGGIGKTALAARLGDSMAGDFDLAIWRSLREAPPLNQLMSELVQFISEFTEIDVPSSSDRSISRLLYHLRRKRCLIVLDNIEAIVEAGEYTGNYRLGYADYGRLFHSVGTTRHQSCLLFTSREPPPEIAELAGDDLPVRSLWLSGLATNAPTLLNKIGLQGSDEQLLAVSERCQGNPLYLRIVANTIVNSFNGEIESFLSANQFAYGKIANVLQSQLDRLSPTEKLIIYHLAIQREPISLANIETHLQLLGRDSALVQTIDSLQQRSILEVTQGQRYTLQNVVMEFMTGATIRELVGEIDNDNLCEPLAPQQELFFFNSLALYPASSPTYIRDVQQRLILRPIVGQISVEKGRDKVIELCHKLLYFYRQAGLIPGYGGGNIIDILMALEVDLQGYNLTNLAIAEVDFQAVSLRNVNFTGSTFDRCRFAQGMGTAIRLTFSPNGKYLAACDTNYQIKVWEVATNQEIAMLIGHQSWVWDVQFSQDCKYLVSGSSDETMRIWDLASGECLQVLHGHRDWVWRVNFAINHNLAISIGADRQIKIWWWRTKVTLLTFPVPDLQVRDASFQGSRGLLATCGGEGIKIWQVWAGRRIQKIGTDRARSLRLVSLSPDGKTIVGANFSCTIHCWDLSTGHLLFDLLGHPTQVSEVNYDDIGRMISTCLEQVRVWNLQTGACIKVINFGNDSGKAAAYRAPLMATGSDNGVIKVWNLETGQCIATSGGTSARVLGIASNAHNQIVVSSKDDGTLNLWDFGSFQTQVPEKVDSSPQPTITAKLPPSIHYQAHRGMATSIAFSPNGRLIASTGSDRSIKIWDVSTGEQLQTLIGHTDYIPQLLFADDRTILSRSYDATIRQWDIITGEWKIVNYLQRQWVMVVCRSPDCQLIGFGSDTPALTILNRNTGQTASYPAIGNRLRQLNFSHDARFIVGITDDRIVNLWDTTSDYEHRHWKIGARDATAAIPHPKLAHLLIIGSDDGSISILDLQTQTCLDRIIAHQHEILALSIVPQPDRVVSCSVDGSIKVWGLIDTRLTAAQYSIDFGMPYQNLQLSGVKGLNPSQLATLVRLGAVK
jgi:WD40 repeat protein